MRGLKDREQMYRLIVSQMYYDGYQKDAAPLAATLGLSGAIPPPSDKLFRWFLSAKNMAEDTEKREPDVTGEPTTLSLDLEYDSHATPTTAEPAMYETIYITSHKQPCRALAFSNDGSLVATGSADCSIKLLDVDRIIARDMSADEISAAVAQGVDTDKQTFDMPIVRTLYDHTDEVTCVDFHPRNPLLVSGSKDHTIKMYDFSRPAVRRSFRSIQEVEPIRCLSIHPSGEWLMVGTKHPTLRLYNLNTSQCYSGTEPHEQHKNSVNNVAWSHDGRLLVSGGRDGDVKLWDGVSNRCILTLTRAHEGQEICSVQLTQNSKYVLTAGRDSQVKLWELAAGGRCLVAYTGAGQAGPASQEFNIGAQLNHAEDYVMFPDEKSCSLCSWDARTAERKRLLPLGHNGAVRAFVHSPSQAAFVTGSDDFRVRFWFKKGGIL